MRSVFALLVVALAVVAFNWTGATAQVRKVRVHVKPVAETAGGFVDAKSKRLADSRADFVKHFRSHKEVTIVESADGADLVLELLSSAEEGFGRTSTERIPIPGSRSTTTDEAKRPTIKIKMVAGPYESEIVGAGPTWKSAGYDASFQIRKFVRDNSRKLLAAPRGR